jgi:hypothetical protein
LGRRTRKTPRRILIPTAGFAAIVPRPKKVRVYPSFRLVLGVVSSSTAVETASGLTGRPTTSSIALQKSTERRRFRTSQRLLRELT